MCAFLRQCDGTTQFVPKHSNLFRDEFHIDATLDELNAPSSRVLSAIRLSDRDADDDTQCTSLSVPFSPSASFEANKKTKTRRECVGRQVHSLKFVEYATKSNCIYIPMFDVNVTRDVMAATAKVTATVIKTEFRSRINYLNS